jgi:hypothetical protein
MLIEADRLAMLVALLGACPMELVLDIEDGRELDEEDR